MSNSEQLTKCRPALLFEACPKCERGDLELEREAEEIWAHCVRCSYTGRLKTLYTMHARGSIEKMKRLRPVR